MFSREDRILGEILVSRGLVARERLEECMPTGGETPVGSTLAERLVGGGHITRFEAERALAETRSIEKALSLEMGRIAALGEFRIIREIGRGGMGIVYEAEQVPLGRRVALKVLPAGAALDDRLANRFLREGSAAARLRHPGLV